MNMPSSKKSKFRKSIGIVSLLVGVGVTTLHYFQFDRLAAITLIPPWCWICLAFILTAVSARSLSRRTFIFVVAVWGLFAGMFVEEFRSSLRFYPQPVTRALSASTIRVVTLNCNAGSSSAAVETHKFNPDIVLLQESPGPESVARIAKSIFGDDAGYVCGGDDSIITRGILRTIHAKPGSHYVHAVVTLPNAEPVDVVSLRLSPPVFRMDFLEPGFWNDHFSTRGNHRMQLQEIIDHLKQKHQTEDWIVGGDFNLVGNDGALSPFENLEDSFNVAGAGWSNTGTNDYPLFRVDQIWTTKTFSAKVVRAYKTTNSDHRMVVSDVELNRR